MQQPTSLEEALDTPLSSIAGCWIELHCPCNQNTSFYPVQLLLSERGDQCLRSLLPLFQCPRCGGSPSPVYLGQTTRSFAHGEPLGWWIELIPVWGR